MDRAELSERLGGGRLRHERTDTVVCESDPERFQEALIRAVAAGGRVFLADPAWREAERAEFAAVRAQAAPMTDEEGERGWLCIPTGGSSGRMKLARHDSTTLAAAVEGFVRHFDVPVVNAVGFLPLHHVSGLMAWLRTRLTGGRYEAARWNELGEGGAPWPAGAGGFVSVVPTQLQRLLSRPEAVAWLKSFQAVFVGGGPSWPDLLAGAADAGLPLALSYGMTETAAMVTSLRPDEFAAGHRSAGWPLPHARLACQADGTLEIESASLFRGYFPDWRSPETPFVTADLGRVDAAGFVHVLRRRDAVIITGGEKVDPQAVEEVLRSTGQFADVAVIGVADAAWGQAVVACYPGDAGPIDWDEVRRVVDRELAGYRRPKRFVPVHPWPRSAQGKLNRAALQTAAEAGSVGRGGQSGP